MLVDLLGDHSPDLAIDLIDPVVGDGVREDHATIFPEELVGRAAFGQAEARQRDGLFLPPLAKD